MFRVLKCMKNFPIQTLSFQMTSFLLNDDGRWIWIRRKRWKEKSFRGIRHRSRSVSTSRGSAAKAFRANPAVSRIRATPLYKQMTSVFINLRAVFESLLRQSVNQLYKNNKMSKLVLFSTDWSQALLFCLICWIKNLHTPTTRRVRLSLDQEIYSLGRQVL